MIVSRYFPDRCDLARHNQINSTKKYLKKLNKKMKAQSLAVREAKMAALVRNSVTSQCKPSS